jgi:hypothetical protein
MAPTPEIKICLDKHYLKVNWITSILFVSLSSLIFAWIFEYSRYYAFCDPMSHLMSPMEKALLFWFLVAKSVGWFLPVTGIVWALMAVKLFRVSYFLLIVFWFLSYLIMMVDLSIFGIQGFHSWYYLELFFSGHMQRAEQALSQIWNIASIKILVLIILSMVVFAVSGWLIFFIVRWIVKTLAGHFEWIISGWSLTFLTIGFVLSPLGIFPLTEQFRDRAVDALPLPASQKKILLSFYQSVPQWVYLTKWNPFPESFTDANISNVRDEERFLTKLVTEAVNHETDTAFYEGVLNRPDLPNVLLIVVESLRPDMVGLGSMNGLCEWSKQGLVLNRHYSGSNTTRPGLFSLLSGQAPLHQIRDSEIGFQMIDILKRFGYQTTFITYHDTYNFMHINNWYSLIPCDNFIKEGDYDFNIRNWADSDRKKMKHALRILNAPTDRPKFVLVFLLSSHVPYDFPLEFEICKSQLDWWIWKLVDPKYKIKDIECRYTNSIAFLESEILELIRRLDPSRNIIIVTSDHGESMKEDGVATHGSLPSEVQLRAPLILVGPGIEKRQISTATAHNDLLPTLLHAITGQNVPILNSSGRDLIADPMPADEVVVCPYNDTESQNILFIRKDKRLLFKLSESADNSSKPEFVGMVDEAGQFRFKVKTVP